MVCYTVSGVPGLSLAESRSVDRPGTFHGNSDQHILTHFYSFMTPTCFLSFVSLT